MYGVSRALKRASFRAGRTIGISFLMAVAFVFYFQFLSDESFTLESFIHRFPVMLVYLSNMMYLVYGLTDVAVYSPLEISSGATRKNVFAGSHFMAALQIGTTILLLAAYYMLVPKMLLVDIPMGRMLLFTLAVGLFACGTGMFMGHIVWRFGKVAYYVLIFLVTGGCAILGAMGAMVNGNFVEVAAKMMSYVDNGVMELAAAVWYAVMAAVSYLMLRKAEIRP